MTRWFGWTLSRLMCGVGAAVLGPSWAATAAPALSVGLGTVIADLGAVPSGTQDPGFSVDGAYYAYLSPAGDRCDLHLYDLKARTPVGLVHNHVGCDPYSVHWAAHADTLQGQVNAAAGEVMAYVWDADPGQVALLAPNAHVYESSRVSADGRFLVFTGRSDTHPAPSVDAPRYAGYVNHRTTGVSLPLSKRDMHVHLVSWSPPGHNFVAQTGGRTSCDANTGACLGTGTACRTLTHLTFGYGDRWSRDGSAVLGGSVENIVYDFTNQAFGSLPKEVGYVCSTVHGDGADRLLGNLARGGHGRLEPYEGHRGQGI